MWDVRSLQGHWASSVYALIKNAQIQTKTESASIKWAVTRTVSKNVWAVTRTGRGCLTVRGALPGSSQWKWDAVSLHHPRRTLSPTASGLCLRDANCFCYLCQVPTLPQHILQTGPGPSAAFCVCLRNEKNVGCHLQQAQHCSSSRAVAVGVPQWHTFVRTPYQVVGGRNKKTVQYGNK